MVRGHQTKAQLIEEELVNLRQQVADLQAKEANLQQVERRLEEQEQLYRTVVENLADAIVINEGSRRVFVNRVYLDLLGIDDISQVYEAPLGHFIVPEDRQRVIERTLARQRGENVPSVYEYRLRRPDGVVRTVETSAVPINYSGQPAVLAVLRDISDHKRVEAELRFQSELMRNMPGGVVVIRTGVVVIRTSDGVIVHANSGFEEMFSYGPGELVGKHISVVNVPGEKDPEEVAREVISAVNKVGIWRGDVHNVKKDGTPFWCYTNVSTFEHHEYGNVWIATHADITESKEAEEALRESEARFRSLVQSASDAIVISDEDGNIISCNQATQTIFGCPEVEVWANPSPS
jgi:PAS domain S-box-containing protein